MPFMQWDDSYSVKIGKIDDQHKKLFALVNDLHDSNIKETSSEILYDVLVSLSEYVNYHFRAEELYMEQIDYPGFTDHKIEHNLFVNNLVDLLTKTPSNELTISWETLSFLQNWLVQHIINSDGMYAQYSRTIESGQPKDSSRSTP